MATNQDITKAIAELTASVKKLETKIDNSELANRTMLEMRWKEISQKFDIFANLNEKSAQQLADDTSNKSKKPNRPTVYKELFLKQRDQYMNVLFTQDEIDMYMQHADVVKKTKMEDKYGKVQRLIYDNHVKTNTPEGRLNAFESVYAKYIE
jgi:hypothetical protein